MQEPNELLLLAVEEVKCSVDLVESMTSEVWNAVRGVESSIAASGGVIVHLSWIHDTLKKIQWILVAILIVAALHLLKSTG